MNETNSLCYFRLEITSKLINKILHTFISNKNACVNNLVCKHLILNLILKCFKTTLKVYNKHNTIGKT